MTAIPVILGLLLSPLGEPEADRALASAIEDFEFGEHTSAARKLRKLLDPIRLENAEDRA